MFVILSHVSFSLYVHSIEVGFLDVGVQDDASNSPLCQDQMQQPSIHWFDRGTCGKEVY